MLLSLHPGLTAALLCGVFAAFMRPTPEPAPGEEKLIVKELTVILLMVAATVIIPPVAVYHDELIAFLGAHLYLALGIPLLAAGSLYFPVEEGSLGRLRPSGRLGRCSAGLRSHPADKATETALDGLATWVAEQASGRVFGG